MHPLIKPVVFITVFLLICSAIQAQVIRVTGYVRDADTREPLLMARVYAGTVATFTNDTGWFSLELPEISGKSLTVSAFGYTTQVEPVPGQDSILHFLLIPASLLLEPIVVSGGKKEESINNATVSIMSVQPYLLENRITTGMDNLVDQLPAVNVSDGQVNIRSGSGWSYGAGSRVLVLLDGLPMISGDAGAAQWNFLPLENVGQIEVIKGAASVLYGSSALNGIINVRTKPAGAKPVTRASLFTGFYGTPPNPSWKWQGNRILMKSGADFLHSQKFKGFDLTISGNYLKDDGYRMSGGEERARLTFNTRFYNPQKYRFSWGVNGNIMQAKLGSFLLWESYALPYTVLDSGYNTTRQWKVNIDPYAVYEGKNFKHALRTRFLHLDNVIENEDPTVNQSNASDLYYAEYQVSAARLGVEGLSLTGGAVAMHSVTNSPLFSGRQRNSNLAAYVQAEQRIRKFTLNAGVRLEHYTLNDFSESRPVYRAGLNYEAAKATFLRASYGQGYRFPSVAESYIQTRAGAVFIYPNPELRSETGWNAEMGIRQGLRAGKKWRAFADVALFRMEYQNMMEFSFGTWAPPTAGNLFGLGFKSINIGRTRIDGIDASITGEGKVGNVKTLLLAGYTFADPVNLDPAFVYGNDIYGNPIRYDSTSSDLKGRTLKYRFRHLVKADMQLEWKRISFGITYKYNSYMENIDRIFESAFFETLGPKGIRQSRINNRQGDHVVDIRAGYQVSKHFKLAAACNNLLNEEYLTRPADMRPPRNYSLQLSCVF